MKNQISKLRIYEMLNLQPVATTNSQAFPRNVENPNFRISKFQGLKLSNFETSNLSNPRIISFHDRKSFKDDD